MTLYVLTYVGELYPKDSATDCYCLVTQNSQQSSLTLGTYTIKWKRCGDLPSRVLTSTVSFPPVTAKYQAYSISAGLHASRYCSSSYMTHDMCADIPAYGQLMSVLPVSYTVHNNSTLVQEFEAKMGASDAFMYSGNRTVSTTCNTTI